MSRVYLAGPDVFAPDHRRIFRERTEICRSLGLSPLVPADDDTTEPAAIYAANLAMLGGCDAVIADVTPFRGPHCDPGTAWEIGYAAARGTPVFAFSASPEPLAARVAAGDASARTDRSGMLIEPFGLAENLMIVQALSDRTVHRTFRDAARAAARALGAAGG
ncbi:MAG: nucleoside 2-deoxyribosyltransferase [Candidatus Rokubacteria bacterium]|nr:nucleoside 2-deoxyribosyltransferase [Candidatus Rokubacteria bacterium]